MMALYAVGFIAVYLVFGLMYHHAFRKRRALNLSDDDVFFALQHIGLCIVMVAVGVLSATIALTVPVQIAAPASGFSYFLIGPAQWVSQFRLAKNRAHLLARVAR